MVPKPLCNKRDIWASGIYPYPLIEMGLEPLELFFKFLEPLLRRYRIVKNLYSGVYYDMVPGSVIISLACLANNPSQNLKMLHFYGHDSGIYEGYLKAWVK